MLGKSAIDVLVVGAGPVGMFTALKLAKRGLKVRIVDRALRTNQDSFALGLHPASLAMLNEEGLMEGLVARGRPIERTMFYDHASPVAISGISMQSVSPPHALVIPQSELERVLVLALRTVGIQVEWGTEVTQLDSALERGLVAAHVSRLHVMAQGYAVSDMSRVETGTDTIMAGVVVGADGAHSAIRRMIEAEVLVMEPTRHYAVFEFETRASMENEQTVVFSGGYTSALWPMAKGRARWTFEISPQRSVLPTMHDFEALAAERAPWFAMDSTNLTWTSRVTFTKYHVRPFGLGRVLLVGDSAHQTGPVGIQSMNIGLREGDQLAQLLGEEGAIAHPERAVIAYDEACAAEWRWMLDARSREASFSVDEAWLRRHEEEILSSLPASGKLLRDLMSELRVLPAGIK